MPLAPNVVARVPRDHLPGAVQRRERRSEQATRKKFRTSRPLRKRRRRANERTPRFIPPASLIDRRPAVVGDRLRVGDWEAS